MVENIYFLDNAKDNKNINIRLPRNIRQIGHGQGDTDCQIYIQDYVMTCIEKDAEKTDRLCYGVLLGEKKQANGYTYVFITGFVEVEDIIENTLIFNDEIWTEIYDKFSRFYRDADIVGWYNVSVNGFAKDMVGIRKIHLDNFPGKYKVILNIDKEEDEENFYIYEGSGLKKQPCYHIYYDKSKYTEDYIFGTGKNAAYTEKGGRDNFTKGKYGIEVNAINEKKQQKQTEPVENISGDKKLLTKIHKYKKINLGKAASFTAIAVLVATLAFMGKTGKLDRMTDMVSNTIKNIVNPQKDQKTDLISVNGNINMNRERSENISSEKEDVSKTVNEEITDKNNETGREETAGENNETGREETTGGNNETGREEITGENNETDREETADENKETGKTENKPSVSEDNKTYETHVVQKGETLYSIAMSRYGNVNVIDEIKRLNNMENADYVMAGQKIVLP